ncbi:MAG: adenosylmethionine--8-amino-7-oxononanoate transaminase [Balneolales bacterium]
MKSSIWHPFTQMKTAAEPLKVRSGKGIWLELEDGRMIMDLISSWWVNLHGHSQPDIAKAIYDQAQKLEHVIFAGFTHDPAEQLSKRLIPHLPDSVNRIFFSDNGSTAVEVALKMAWQYWKNKGETGRNRFIAFEGSYHGDTVGAMSAGSRSMFFRVFNDLLFDVQHVPYPSTFIGDDKVEQKEAESLKAIARLFEENPAQYAGLIIEPLVQGSGGMRMCRPEFLQKLDRLVHEHQTLLIYDEVMTGFGRTGDWFASIKTNTKPDLMCLSKGITGGFLPLSVTACSDDIYQAFYSDDPMKTLYHGHSYTANPLGCAAALASLTLMENNTAAFKNMDERHCVFADELAGNPAVNRVRFCGTIIAMDVVTGEEEGYLNQVSGKIKEQALEKNMLLRPLGNTLYLMPPYCITDEELQNAYKGITEILAAVSDL